MNPFKSKMSFDITMYIEDKSRASFLERGVLGLASFAQTPPQCTGLSETPA